MLAVIQRVKRASVNIDTKTIATINHGVVVLLGIEKKDSTGDAMKLSTKIKELRIFEDTFGKMNLSIIDIKGQILVVPEFTLCANVSKGRRPSFDNAETQEPAKKRISEFTEFLKSDGIVVKEGEFGEHMLVDIENDGPVTFVLDSREL